MGLLDVLNGMQNGPRGQSTPSSEQSGGMSPMTMALLGLLAWKAFKHLTAGQPDAAPASQQRSPLPPPTPVNAGSSALPGGPGDGGGLSDLLKGGLGGLLAGGAAGTVLSGGLGDLLNQLQQGGHGEAANSWVGKGENKAIAPGDLASALGADQIESLSAQSGLSRDELLSGLSQYLPKVVDHLTPDGRLPTENELSGRI
ncbi:YidB family protein [Bradyrhizobium sp. CB2312]|uniref:YidB family protein n=1 Tax=Bradyrhizobium sp. CB2312 TaxID=3039155 RepID=UPI0024B0D4CB|nr:YidB family protein [Bradyrhizobium sp. CB2312]WFU72284.1 YidB family protein [Bradyrhizobium sp. CB2312]